MSAGYSGKSLLSLLLFTMGCLAVGGLGGAATVSSVQTWFPTLVKPAFNPPDWVFGPVWTMLYLMMGVAVWRVWNTPVSRTRTIALWLFTTQLALNLLWSVLFFGMRRPDLALIDIVTLLTLIIFTAMVFRQCDRVSAILFLPYIAWVSFATILNGSIWWLNA